MSEEEISTIRLTKKTKKRLRRHGIKGQTYDEVVNDLLDMVEEERNE